MPRTFTTINGVAYVSVNGGRRVPEWIGKTPDSMPTPTVQARIFSGCNGICMIAGRKIAFGERWVMAHRVALADGGENRESNILPALEGAHQKETGRENSQRASERRKTAKAIGIKSKPKSRPIPGSKASGWKHRMDGTFEKR